MDFSPIFITALMPPAWRFYLASMQSLIMPFTLGAGAVLAELVVDTIIKLAISLARVLRIHRDKQNTICEDKRIEHGHGRHQKVSKQDVIRVQQARENDIYA